MGIGYIKLPLSFAPLFENLSDAQIGRLVCSMLEFCTTGEEPNFQRSDPLFYVWPMCRENVVDSLEAYERQCAANRENGKKGGRPPKQTQSEYAELDE